MLALLAKAFGFGASVVDWRATFTLAAMRSAAGGLVWGLIVLFGGGELGMAMMYILLGVVFGLLFFIPFGVVFALIARVFPPAGLACLVPIAYMVVGDPVLWMIERARPGTVPANRFKPFNFNTIIFVINEELVDSVRDGVTSAVRNTASGAIDRLSQFGKDA
jgi:ABC-type polysaccharide/polyol phosphate export permease